MNIRLQSLKLKNFRSFEEGRVDFPDQGLVVLRGPSGSGKSTINIGIAHALGYSPFPATQLRSWFNEDDFGVELQLEANGEPVVISRGSKNSLKVGSGRTVTAAASIQEKLRQVIGFPSEIVEALTYRRQKSSGLFVSKPDSEKKEFLSTVLGLDALELAVEEAKSKLKSYELEYERLTAMPSVDCGEEPQPVPPRPALLRLKQELTERVALLSESVTNEKKADAAACEAIANKYRDQMSELDAQRRAISKQVFLAETEFDIKALNENLEEAKRRVNRAITVESEKQSQQRNAVLLIQNRIASKQRSLDGIKTLEQTIKKVDDEIASLSEQTCPTCDQFWLGANDRRKELQELNTANRNALARLKDEAAKFPDNLEEELEKANQPIPQDPIVSRLLAVQSQLLARIAAEQQRLASAEEIFRAEKAEKMAAINSVIHRLELEMSKEQSAVMAAHKEVYAELQFAMEELNKVNQDIHVFEIMSMNRQREIDDWRSKMDAKLEREKEINRISGLCNQERDFIAMIGREGFLGSIFDEVLDEIAVETNKILVSVPNVAHVTVKFRSETITQKGTTKRSIVPVVFVGGYEAPLASGLSGGMGTSVELAIDLAVAEVIARRSGHSLGWLILDETFDGLSVNDREACLAILRSKADDKLIIVVDHMSETKESFSQAFDFSIENGKSTVERSK